jgi:hypothetical protein
MKQLKTRLVKMKNRIVEKWKATLIVIGIVLVPLIVWKIPEWQVRAYHGRLDASAISKLDPKDFIQLQKDLITAENNARATIAQIIGGLVLLLGLYATFKNVWVAEEGKLTERFSKAVELLGNDKLDIRLGGIYALERIARDSRKDHWTVMEVLTAFVREQSTREYGRYIPDASGSSAIPTENDFKLREDIQAALTVIGRRKWVDREPRVLDLSNSFLGRASLSDANLSKANLWEANLYSANLTGAFFVKANLVRAILQDANLTDADFSYANLVGAHFRNANLTGADLGHSSGLAWMSISEAIIDETTKLPFELERRRKAEQEKKVTAPNQ